MPSQGKSGATAAAPRTTGGSAELHRLRNGESTLDEYLDFRADESVKSLEGLVPADKLRMIRDVNRELLATDPVLIAQLTRLTAGAKG
jgi:hypothetical protein